MDSSLLIVRLSAKYMLAGFAFAFHSLPTGRELLSASSALGAVMFFDVSAIFINGPRGATRSVTGPV